MKPAITTIHETRPLRCVLTDAERIAAGRKLAEKCAELQRTEEFSPNMAVFTPEGWEPSQIKAAPAPEHDSPAKWRKDLIAQYGKKAVTKAEDGLLARNAEFRRLDGLADEGDVDAGMQAVKMLAEALHEANAPIQDYDPAKA